MKKNLKLKALAPKKQIKPKRKQRRSRELSGFPLLFKEEHVSFRKASAFLVSLLLEIEDAGRFLFFFV